MSKAISLVCHNGFHRRCGHDLLNHTTCTCWCHDLPGNLPECDDCWGLGDVPSDAPDTTGLMLARGCSPCPACDGTGKRGARTARCRDA